MKTFQIARARVGGAVLLVLIALVVFTTAGADAATVSNAWRAKIGTAGANGTATISAYTSGTGSIALKLTRFWANASLPIMLSKGTCATVGTTLIRFPAIRTTSAGAAARTSSLTASQMTLVKNATKGTGRIAIRVGSSATGGVRCGLFAVLPVAAPSLPPVDDTLYMGPYYRLTIPAGWVPSSDGAPGYAKVVFAGPAGQKLLANAVPMSISLDELVAQIIAAVKSGDGVDPERNESITIAGVPGRLLAYHFTNAQGMAAYEIDAFCVVASRGYELSYVHASGSEAADDAFFARELASFGFGPGF